MTIVIFLVGRPAGASTDGGSERNDVTFVKSAAVFTAQGRACEPSARKTSATGLPGFVLSSAGSWNLRGSKSWTAVECTASRGVPRFSAESWRERGPPAS